MDNIWKIIYISGLYYGVTGRSYWSNKPWIMVDPSEIALSDSVRVLCGVPIDYTGGFCHLYRQGKSRPLKSVQTYSYTCEFQLSAQEVLDHRLPGTRTSVWCNYELQSFVSIPSDTTGVTVLGTMEKPQLTVSSQVVLMDGKVHVNCTSMSNEHSICTMYKDGETLHHVRCNDFVNGSQLMMWQKTFNPYNPINLTCVKEPVTNDYIRSQRSNSVPVLVVDVNKLSIPEGDRNGTIACPLSMEAQAQIKLHGENTTLFLNDGRQISFEATENIDYGTNYTCRYVN